MAARIVLLGATGCTSARGLVRASGPPELTAGAAAAGLVRR